MALLTARGRLGLLPALALVFAGAAFAAELRVRPGESIAAAIDSAAPGDTVLVERGVYRENLLISKPLTLKGLNRPRIDGGLKGDTIRVEAVDVTLSGLLVTDSGDDLGAQNAGIYIRPGAHRARVENCAITYSLFGLWIEKANDVRIVGNLITGKRDLQSAQRGNGIQLYNTTGALIENNHVSFVRDGIYVDVSHRAVFRGNHVHHTRYGTHYMNSYHNVWENNAVHDNRGGLALMETRDQLVRNNRVWNNSDHGIMLRTIQDSVVENNIVAGNQRGFFIYDAEYNTLRGNLVIDNEVGVHLWAGSFNNQVDRNDFIRNRQQVRYVATRDQDWGKKEGNFWSNYLGWDRDGDGRGDVPYEASDVVDRLVARLPVVKLLLNSPAIQTLRLISRQFPVLRAPSVVDANPRMRPHYGEWNEWIGKQR
ncbi:MAG: nitrous oxide reductase family maturation protein NosD [Betaproteobacteria bacterium]|nr:nitrous oxide reductase family maturation protein NosD [Betaproteobacteria bacterium]